MKPEWVNSPADAVITLPDDKEEAVYMYLHWLYSRTVPISANLTHDAAFALLCKAYVLGERLMDIKFKNQIISTIFAQRNEWRYCPVGQSVAILYAGTPETSPARRLFVHLWAYWFRDDESWRDGVDACPKEFLKDVLCQMSKWRLQSPAAPGQMDFQVYCEVEKSD
ncbi:hypothetical protein BDV96DRAFT_129498 [Lophiotrema nucula]|uniref:BTB domain-containing protein n=1 Tax=Lophiotrema nucula TaxID=690887 RepID=A0A6A5ZRB0_9PLEO|nr:hypothetical protein BDV96DRAFT_129498 [Lophiotrema nucula]